MAVDVETAVEIARPRDVVAAFAADPDDATVWYENIKSVEWKTPVPMLAAAMHRANRKDLAMLKATLEDGHSGFAGR